MTGVQTCALPIFTIQFPVVCDKVVHDDPNVVCMWEIGHVFDNVKSHVPDFGIFLPRFSKKVLVGFSR